ncbi:lipase family protein [Trichocoleus sp. FACHB-591]|uniref:lipase family protein n=1 Tax=Trichocoleus sp. FACHB-591 TaxID=2692872 RepID=UPI00168221A2|nr:lipase family protein [Trichocoleus sp. FACHB-591]MBD2093782.1 lipase family protein [Trichocoleus sp. FACHB-591]
MPSSSHPNMTEDRVIVSQVNTYPEGFDPSMARTLAGLIQQAYQQFDLFEQKNNSQSRSDLQIFNLEKPYQLHTELAERDIPFGFVASDASSENIYVIFRGTRRFVEWFKDANIQLVSLKDSTDRKKQKVEIKEEIVERIVQENQSSIVIPQIDNEFGFVTAGFRGIYISLRQKLIAALNQKSPNAKVFVTGHSLGGALATLAIPDILKNTHFTNPENIVLYTFASPRCGDRNFAMSFQGLGIRHWRIANTEDFVTMLPFPTGNVFKSAPIDALPEEELGIGGVAGVDKNPNPIFGFFKAMYDRNKRRMPDYAHTGTPIYFTIHESALEKHHNLDEVYMLGISQDPLTMTAKTLNKAVEKTKDMVINE